MNDAVLKNLLFLFVRLRRFELSPSVLSVIAAEMYFRGALHRTLEYCAWVALWQCDKKRTETLSVGIAQIQLKRWEKLGYINSCCPSLTNLKAVSNIENNYLACLQYLTKMASSENTNPKALSELYSGKARIFHAKVIETALNTIVEISLIKATCRVKSRGLNYRQA